MIIIQRIKVFGAKCRAASAIHGNPDSNGEGGVSNNPNSPRYHTERGRGPTGSFRTRRYCFPR